MGFTHDTSMVQFIPPAAMAKTAGTWTPTLASNVVCDARTAGAGQSGIIIPIELPGNSAALKGSYLTKIDVTYSIATADANDFATVELEKQVIPANGSAQTASAVAITLDGNNDTAAKRKVQGNRTLTVTLTTPVWLGAGDAYYLYLYIDCAATTVLKIFGSRAYYTGRS